MVTVEGEGYLFSCGVWLGLLFGAEVLESVQRVGSSTNLLHPACRATSKGQPPHQQTVDFPDYIGGLHGD